MTVKQVPLIGSSSTLKAQSNDPTTKEQLYRAVYDACKKCVRERKSLVTPEHIFSQEGINYGVNIKIVGTGIHFEITGERGKSLPGATKVLEENDTQRIFGQDDNLQGFIDLFLEQIEKFKARIFHERPSVASATDANGNRTETAVAAHAPQPEVPNPVQRLVTAPDPTHAHADGAKGFRERHANDPDPQLDEGLADLLGNVQ